jgi:hypothetical protein
MTGAAGVTVSTAPVQGAGPGSSPRATLQAMQVLPVPFWVARSVLVRHHYLHSMPGGSKLAFGVFMQNSLRGAVTLGVGPYNAPSLVSGATSDDGLTLSRLWLSAGLPRNSESRVLGIILRSLRRHTSLKFLLTYADPSQGHVGTIYQATGWLYTGLSEAMPLYDIGDGKARHSRSLSHAYGSHSIAHFRRHGVAVELVTQEPKHRYAYFLDGSWRGRLLVPVLPYPKKEEKDGSC